MYKLILASVFLTIALHLEAQTLKEREVPTAVVDKVNSLYPDASKLKWESVDGTYEASFVSDNKETTLVMSNDGIVVITEKEIEIAALPGSIMQYFSTQHPTAKVTEAEIITDNFGSIKYEIEADGVDYIFDSKGNFISLEDEEEGKE